MQRLKCSIVTCGFVLGASVGFAEDATSNPLAKTIELIDGLAAKITVDGEAEEKAFKKYFEYCDDNSKQLHFEIKTSTSQQEGIEAKISQLESVIEVCDTKIEELGTAISSATEDLSKATAIREQESKTFKLNEKELVSAIDTLGRAETALQEDTSLAQMSVGATAERMNKLVATMGVVVDAAGFSLSDKNTLMALVQDREDSEEDMDAEDEETGAPAGAAYEKKSGGIVEVIQDMKEKAEIQLGDLRKQETKAQFNYNMLKQSLDDQLAEDKKQMDATKSSKAEASEEKSTNDGELAVTKKALAESKSKLKEAQKDCMQVAADHEATVVARNEELKQVAVARKILVETTGGAEGESYSFLQASSPKHQGSETVQKVKQLAKRERSAALAQLAMKIAAAEHYAGSSGIAGVFDKVKGMLQDMMAKLEAEAEAEAEEKGFCDKEMGKTTAKKDDLDAETEKLTARKDVAVSKSTELKGEVKGLQKELLALTQSQGEADKIRQEKHADFVQTKADLEKGLAGVQSALGVLRDYYAKKEDDAALLQEGAGEDQDASFDSLLQQPKKPAKHSKSGGAGGSIIGILEIVESDFAENLAKEEAEEADDKENYESMTQKNQVTKAEKEQDVKFKTKEYKSLDKTISELESDLGVVGDELGGVMEYLSKLKERCIAKPDTYAERKKRRDKEIAGLKEALATLESETFLQRHSKKHLRRAAVKKHMRGSTGTDEMAAAVGA